MIAFLIFAGLIAVFWIVNTVIGKTTDAASRAVFKKSYQSGQSEMHRGLEFQSPSSCSDLANAIVAKVNAHASAPPIADGLYLAERSDNSIVFAFGSKGCNPLFRAGVHLLPTDSGSTGTFGVLEWKERGGVEVLGHKRIEPLIKRISIAVTELGGSVREVQHA